jgi:hypothetical protein
MFLSPQWVLFGRRVKVLADLLRQAIHCEYCLCLSPGLSLSCLTFRIWRDDLDPSDRFTLHNCKAIRSETLAIRLRVKSMCAKQGLSTTLSVSSPVSSSIHHGLYRLERGRQDCLPGRDCCIDNSLGFPVYHKPVGARTRSLTPICKLCKRAEVPALQGLSRPWNQLHKSWVSPETSFLMLVKIDNWHRVGF